MTVTIRVANEFATIDQYKWTSSNKSLENTLNSFLNKGGPSPSDPYPDHTMAIKAAKLVGGKVIKVDPLKIPLEKGVVY